MQVRYQAALRPDELTIIAEQVVIRARFAAGGITIHGRNF